MKPFSLFCLLFVLVGLGGCNDQPPKSAAGHTEAPDDHGINFKAKEGLAVPDDIARNIGLQLADVTERKVNGQLTFTAQVYGEAGPQARRVALASAWVDRAAAQFVPVGLDIVAQTADTNSLTGVVARVLRAADTNTAVEVLLELRAEQGELRPGDFVRVTVSLPGTEAVPVVPEAALLRSAEGSFVYVVNGSRLKRTPVKLGGGQDGIVAVRDGLLVGDKVVVRGVPLLWLAELQSIRGGKSCCDVH
ncbi:MAG: hypothetical protein ABMA26_08805 [Limisphaerales bacterium]